MKPAVARTLRRWGLMLCLATGLAGSARADVSPVEFDAANKLYEGGKFSEAAAAYERLLASGQASEALYFNLGNAWFKAGQLGRALEAYHHAEQFNPRDPDLRANLRFARNQVQGPTLTPSAWQRALGRFSVNEWTCAGAAGLWLSFALLILGQLRPGLRPMIRSYLIMSVALTALLCAGALAALKELKFGNDAVVIVREVPVRQGPLEESQTAFTVHDGAELQVLDQKDDWLQVRIDPRRFGWLRRDQVRSTTP